MELRRSQGVDRGWLSTGPKMEAVEEMTSAPMRPLVRRVIPSKTCRRNGFQDSLVRPFGRNLRTLALSVRNLRTTMIVDDDTWSSDGCE